MQDINPKLLEPKCDANQILELIIKQNKSIQTFAEHNADASSEFSQWNVAQHIEHIIYTTKTGIFLLLEAIENSTIQTDMHQLGKDLLARGAFPLKQTQAPDFAIPKNMSHKKLQSSAKRLLSSVENLTARTAEINQATNTSKHPILGGFTALHWLQFIALHQNHHIEIIKILISDKNA